MTTILEENTPKRWPRIIGILAVLAIVVMLLWRFAFPGNPQDCPGDCPIKPKVTQTEAAYAWYFDANGQVTKATGRGGEVLYDGGRWSPQDQRLNEHGIHSGNLISVYQVEIKATLAAPNKLVKGVASLDVMILTGQFGKLAEAYNTINKDGRRLKDTVDSPAEAMLETVLAHYAAKGDVTIQFVAVNPKTDKNKIIADAYAKGYAPWELAKGTPDFDYNNKYVWDFACTRYDVEVNKKADVLTELGQSLPLKVKMAIAGGEASGPELWSDGAYWANTKTPCGVEVASKGNKPNGPPTPTPPPKPGNNPDEDQPWGCPPDEDC